ncbi:MULTISPECIES: hypothetical protein [unclassified Mesorhizobium]|uniref:hypothetical protein n=1 Tax=unclassified Mesorhizobium TaxID=325217 RepID=UPI000FDC0D99|nr:MULTISPECIES: hypothetical protein [unclassified Mesorhizobium]TGQ41979.1 hypothetical protein EN859_011315 [Mesorhizobium sp. M00.F.Ca.ET.216.01.1.1]TIS53118.1 MAG: hypothetical protein E5W91_32400 [Mesorhizobium sp.]TIS86640.1 MAG: hypothetical protein E5W89_28125 [Mesorhizobium sp.]TJW14818.1 MAG: hypothetical protein E5W82_08745 [Mesorhizobium sp.]TJW40824.1 MAG: hypothetical protein E5W83_27500 [Mesorhizobium sp.]
MSLPVLVAIVVFGVALSVLAVHLTGGTKTATLAGADQARNRFAEDFPDEMATGVRLTADARTAFLDLGRGRSGIVHSVGDCFLTRIVTPRDVAALSVDGAGAISLRLADFTWKGGRFTFADKADGEAVVAALGRRNQIKEAA